MRRRHWTAPPALHSQPQPITLPLFFCDLCQPRDLQRRLDRSEAEHFTRAGLQVQQVLGGGLLSLEPAALRQQDAGSSAELRLGVSDWGADSDVFNAVSSSGDATAEDVAAALAAHTQQLQAQWKQEQRQQGAAVTELGQLAVSPAADKENQGPGGGKRGGKQSGAVDWEDFLSGEFSAWKILRRSTRSLVFLWQVSRCNTCHAKVRFVSFCTRAPLPHAGGSQVLQPSNSSRAASVSSSLSRQASAQPLQGGCLSPPLPATPQQHWESAASGQQEDEAAFEQAATGAAPEAGSTLQAAAADAAPQSAAGAELGDAAAIAEGDDSWQLERDAPAAEAISAAAAANEAAPTGTASSCGSPARHSATRAVQPPPSPSPDPIAEQARPLSWWSA